MQPTTEATRLTDSRTPVQPASRAQAFSKFIEDLAQTNFRLWVFRIGIDTISAYLGAEMLRYGTEEATEIAFGGASITAAGFALAKVISKRQMPEHFSLFQRATTCDSVGGLAYYTVGSMSLSLLGAMICWSIRDLLGNAKMDLGEMLASSAVGNAVLFVPLVIAFYLILKGLQICEARNEPVTPHATRPFSA